MKFNFYYLFLLTFVLISCKNEENKNHIKEIKTNQIVSKDTLYEILQRGTRVDSLEYENWKPFLFIKTGFLLSKREKNALIIFEKSENNFSVELYTQLNKKWKKNDAIENINLNPTQFYINIEDYNFDNYKDIYLQSTASNGWSLSRGTLLTITKNKKIIHHPETQDLTNMYPDEKTKTIYTDEIDFSKDGRIVNKRINKWENGKLIHYGLDKSKKIEY